jgi:heme exporter protein D
MFLPAVFGIKSSGLNLAANLVILFLVVVWLALIYWTYADARRRVGDQMLVWCATAASFFPFVGTIVYMIVRPPEYLEDVRERELEMQAVEARLAQSGYQLCPHCKAEVEKDFLRCPSCLRKLKDPCRTCGKPLDPSWRICPFCESEVGAMTSTPRRARRRRDAPSPSAAAAPSPAASGPAPSQAASGPAPATAEPPAAGQPQVT